MALKILLIMADAHMHKLRVGSYVRSMREAPLTLTTLAGLVSRDSDIEWKLVDGSIDRIPLEEEADLVGISVLTGTAPEAYRIADYFRARKIPVVLGGVHVSILPGEAIGHADSIVIGMAERAWPALLEDFRNGKLKRIYRDENPPPEHIGGIAPARRDLQRHDGYMMPNTVHATRGCKRVCDFCTVPVVWPHYLKRPVDDVIRDIKSLRGRMFCFNDVSLIDDVQYSHELFSAMIPLKKRWGGLVTTEILKHPDLLEIMARSGCSYLLLGFESVNQSSLVDMRKGFNKTKEYKEIISALHHYDISVQGCYIFGLDDDDKSIFEATVQQVMDLKVDIPRYSIYTPYPGTALFKRMLAENRMLSFNWNDYDTMHVVCRPLKMTPDELYDGFKWAYKETFRIPGIARRLTGCKLTTAINFIGNLSYRIFVHRLYHEPRFATPYSIHDPCLPPDEHSWTHSFLEKNLEKVPVGSSANDCKRKVHAVPNGIEPENCQCRA